ncbi:MAG: DUF6421 family protein [Chthoniobacteraceae bacterium]
MHIPQRKTVRVLFDEWHSESWSCSLDRAREFQPENPAGASYQRAADALAARDFIVGRNIDAPLGAAKLEGIGVLVLAHPCDPHWERTTSPNSPAFSPAEIEAVHTWVRAGGGLLVITEYEHDKYGDNLNELLAPAGIRIENGKVFDRTACAHDNPEWFLAAPGDTPLAHRAARACFYRAGWCTGGNPAWTASEAAHPPNAAVIATATLGSGRIAVVSDSVLFGDERFGEHDHAQLWLNIVYWLAAPRATASASAPLREMGPLRGSINALRVLQSADGSVPDSAHERASALLDETRATLTALAPEFPHESEYFAALDRDFHAWRAAGFPKPDFAASLAAFAPQQHRRDGIETLAVFPLYTPNASSDVRFEAILFRTPWPEWLAQLERTRFHNNKFVPGHLLDFTDGYASECAVLFPETVSVAGAPTHQFATIFCDREAARLQRTVLRCAEAVRLALHPELEFWLRSPVLIEDTLALWDLIHDTSHSAGELPFDPFMIRQRAPFWMYGIEELRVDLRSYGEAAQLAREGFPFARYVGCAIVLDRIFRFPITGSRVRNYDALGGQLLFAFLHQRDAIVWSDNRLTIRWELLDDAVAALAAELRALYKFGSDCSKMTFWLAAHDLIARHVPPNVASKWRADARAVTDEADPKRWLDVIHPDEFPLGTFHTNLQRTLGSVPARGI